MAARGGARARWERFRAPPPFFLHVGARGAGGVRVRGGLTERGVGGGRPRGVAESEHVGVGKERGHHAGLPRAGRGGLGRHVVEAIVRPAVRSLPAVGSYRILTVRSLPQTPKNQMKQKKMAPPPKKVEESEEEESSDLEESSGEEVSRVEMDHVQPRASEVAEVYGGMRLAVHIGKQLGGGGGIVCCG